MPNSAPPINMPVYLFTGFLEAGKTKFIQGTLEDPRFNEGERTLLLLCEDGELEYDPNAQGMENVFIECLENESDLTPKVLTHFAEKHKATRVMIEYNGMWQLISLFDNLPNGWGIAQEFLFIEAGTIAAYNANMRGLVVDKLSSCDVVVFNRVTEGMDMLMLHQLVRGVSRRANIAYEYVDGHTEYDDIEDPLPFNLDDAVVEIEDEDYALWYRDISEDPKKYQGKVLAFRGRAVTLRRAATGDFAFGRQVMTCCEADIQYCALLARCDAKDAPEDGGWYNIVAKVDLKFHKMYGRKGPILMIQQIQKSEPPLEPVATFY